jgi:hypothetical protein
MNTARKVYTRFWRGSVVVASLALLAYVLYFHHLGTLLPGYSQAEIASYASAADWHVILKDPVNAPYKLPVWLGGAVAHQGLLITRVVSAGFGILAALFFFLIARLRYRYWIACTGTVLFATSAGFLHAARLGTAIVLQLAVSAFIWCVLWYRARYEYRTAIGYVATLLLGILCYIPGILWFELFGLILLQTSIRRQLREVATGHLVAWIVVFLAVIAPLVYATIKNLHLGLEVMGLPQNLHTLMHIPHNLLNTVLAIGIRSDGNPLLWVGHVPLLNVTELTLAMLGTYMYFYRIRRTSSLSSIFLIGCTLLAILLASLGGNVTVVCLVPLLYLLVTSGLNNLLGRWLAVFPRNPIARSSGIVIIAVMLFFSALYQIRTYFVAWPHTPATRQTFNRH